MAIDTAGNVGIGTTSPAYSLDVNGNLRAQISIAAGLNIETLTGNKTLTPGVEKMYQYLNPGTANRDIAMATATANAGDRFVIRNNATGNSNYALVIKQSSTTLDQVYAGAVKEFIFDGTNWVSAANGSGENDNKKYNLSIGLNARGTNFGVALGGDASADTNGVAVGNTAAGYTYGAALGYGAKGYSYGSALGYNAIGSNYGVALGHEAKGLKSGVAIGYRAGYGIDAASIPFPQGNILIGYQAGDTISTGTKNLLIGYDVDVPTSTTSDYMSLGNLIFATGGFGTGTTVGTGNVGIGTTSPLSKLELGSGQISVPLGSESIPSFSFVGDLDTGIYSSGADNFSISLGGTKRANFSSTITRFTTNTLQIGSTASIFTGGTDQDLQLKAVGATNMLLYTNNNERIRIDSSGNVGIGTTSPAEALDVNGRLRLAQTTAPDTVTDKLYNVAGNLIWNGVNLTAGGALPSGTEGQMLYNNAGAWTAFDGMYWDDTNSRLGIGTTSPTLPLTIDRTSNPAVGISVSGSIRGTLAAATAAGAYSTFATVGDVILRSSTEDLILTARNASGSIRFGTGATDAEKVTILNSGNVGIGTTAPGYTLDMNGGFRVGNATSTAGIVFDPSTGNVGIGTIAPGAKLDITKANGSDTPGTNLLLGLMSSPTQGFGIRNNGTVSGMVLDRLYGGSWSPVMSFDRSAGNIGIGTTTPTRKLSFAETTGEKISLYAISETAKDYYGFGIAANELQYQVPSTRHHSFYVGASEQVRIDSTGNIGIGTTTPSSRLHVVGADTSTSTVAQIGGSSGTGLVVLNNGNVGIGTTSPAYLLHVVKSQNSGTTFEVLNDDLGTGAFANYKIAANGANLYAYQFGPNYTSAVARYTASTGVLDATGSGGFNLAASSASGIIRFYTVGNNERLRINNTGNVGIGTTSPGYTLDVNGGFRAGNATSTNALVFDPNSGNVGIGTTSPEYKLDVQGELGVGTGLYTALNGAHLYTGTVYSTNLTAKSNQNLTLGVATAGKNVIINPTSGNVGIGTTSPAAGYKLDVAGNINSAQTVNQETYPSINASQTASELQDGSAYTGTDATMSTQYQAVQFTASDAHTMGDFTVRVKESADITNTTNYIAGYIYADDGGSPSKPTGAALATGNYVRFGTLTTSYQILSMGTSYTLAAGTKYWLVLRYSAAPTGGNIVLDSDVSSNMGATSTDGASWTNTNVRLRYVIRGRTYYAGNFFSTNSYGVRGGSTNSFGVYGNSTNSYGIYGSSTNNYGIYGLSANNVGVYGGSTNGYGVYGNSTNSFGVYGGSTNGIAGYLSINPATTDTVAEVLRLRRQTSGTAADGIGGSINFYAEDSAGTDELTGRIGNLLTTATSGSETSALTFWTRTGGAAIAERLRIDGAGNVGIGTLAGEGNRPVYSDSNGVLTNSSSDIRLKTNIGAIADEMDVIGNLSKLRGIYYNWDTSLDAVKNLGAQREIGMIAQEVQAVMPELVGQNASGYLSLDYPKFTAYLLEVAKAQQSRIDNISLQLTEQGLINSTTTVDSAEESENSLLAKVRNILESLGLAIYDGAASLRRVVVETFSAKTARVEQLEMVDKATGEVYCTWIENGVWEKTEGACGDEPAQNTGSSESPETGSAAGDLEDNNGQSSDEGDPAPAGDSVENTGSSDSADDEEDAPENESDESDPASEAAQETIDPAADGEEPEKDDEPADDTVSEEVSGEEVSEEEISESVEESEDVSENGESL